MKHNCKGLRERGYVTWLSEKNMRAGDDISEALWSGLGRSRFVFILHSGNHGDRLWSKRGLSFATEDEVSSDKKKIVIIKYDDPKSPNGMRQKLCVDYRDKASKPLHKLTALLDGVNGEVIRGVAAAIVAATDINKMRECAERL